jgi:hypothetical protein
VLYLKRNTRPCVVKFGTVQNIGKKVKQYRYRPAQFQRVLEEVRVPRFRDNGTGWW